MKSFIKNRWYKTNKGNGPAKCVEFKPTYVVFVQPMRDGIDKHYVVNIHDDNQINGDVIGHRMICRPVLAPRMF